LRGESSDEVEVIIEDQKENIKRVIISGRPIIDENNYVIAAVANIRCHHYKELENALESEKIPKTNWLQNK
jgi:hypothetical protein